MCMHMPFQKKCDDEEIKAFKSIEWHQYFEYLLLFKRNIVLFQTIGLSILIKLREVDGGSSELILY